MLDDVDGRARDGGEENMASATESIVAVNCIVMSDRVLCGCFEDLMLLFCWTML